MGWWTRIRRIRLSSVGISHALEISIPAVYWVSANRCKLWILGAFHDNPKHEIAAINPFFSISQDHQYQPNLVSASNLGSKNPQQWLLANFIISKQDIHLQTVTEVLQSIKASDMTPMLQRVFKTEGGPDTLDVLMKYM